MIRIASAGSVPGIDPIPVAVPGDQGNPVLLRSSRT
jgi:hypothetical protein